MNEPRFAVLGRANERQPSLVAAVGFPVLPWHCPVRS